MKRIVLVVLTVIALVKIGHSQNTYLNERLSLKLGHSQTPKFTDWGNDIKMGNIRFETNYVFLNFIESGLYLGYSSFRNIEQPSSTSQTSTFFSSYQSNALFYGLNTNIHLLPFFIANEKIRLDFYIGAKMGLISINAPENSLFHGTNFDYGLLGGANYFITQKWGVYVEYGINKKTNFKETEPCLRYGIVIEF